MARTVVALLLFLGVAGFTAAEEKSRVEKEGENLGRSLDAAGKRAGSALERTGNNLWIKKEPKEAKKPKKKKKED